MFVARQVVTNSKGEKVEVLWNSQAYEDITLLNVGKEDNNLTNKTTKSTCG